MGSSVVIGDWLAATYEGSLDLQLELPRVVYRAIRTDGRGGGSGTCAATSVLAGSRTSH